MRLYFFILAITLVTVLFPFAIWAQDSNFDPFETEEVQEEETPFQTEEEPDTDPFENTQERQESTSEAEQFPSEFIQEEEEFSEQQEAEEERVWYPAEDNPATQSGQTQENIQQPSPTPPQNLTYLDYFYYVRVRYGGVVPESVITDYNGDDKIDERDKAIILQALNPNYDPATITPSPSPAGDESMQNNSDDYDELDSFAPPDSR